MSKTTGTVTWETLQAGNDGKLSLQLEGEQLCLQTTDDGKVEVVGVDGKVKFVFDWVSPVDPDDPKVIDIAKTAATQNNLEFERVLMGVKVNAVLGSVYCLVISAKDSTGVSKVFFTVVLETFLKRLVLLFTRVPLPF